MKLSPLQLESYFLTELTFGANQEFNPEKETKLAETDLSVVPEIQRIKDDQRRWQVTITVKLQSKPEANSPYAFTLTLIGIVWTAPKLPEEGIEALIRTNGPTMVYGAAREMVRDITARGPFQPICLPSVSFLPETAKGGTETITKPESKETKSEEAKK
jgi:preprotein translocase subunit SecB